MQKSILYFEFRSYVYHRSPKQTLKKPPNMQGAVVPCGHCERTRVTKERENQCQDTALEGFKMKFCISSFQSVSDFVLQNKQTELDSFPPAFASSVSNISSARTNTLLLHRLFAMFHLYICKCAVEKRWIRCMFHLDIYK